ncbi:TonB-dependent siderophore receptor [Acinetobacter baumannii]|uniref:TonB-dependent siderophore receptor n=1 Tax=Acinetobacter baumannii TaxID=470 RepID=UPI0022237DAF|nr:TonB-dependent receptor plug domain-containing protein [Acinetobacter baumannii]MCW1498738.1 TonB-dependent receptor plug domain-containing protein [Acinetobacter baumannii]
MLITQQKKLVKAISSIMLLASTGTLLHAEVVLPTIKLKASEQDQNGYTVKKSTAATKLDLSLKETPQSVSVITAEQIQDQQLKTLGEVLDQTPGIYQQRYGATGAVGTGGEYASYYARGSKINNFLIDGVVSAPVTSGRTGMSLSTLDPAIYKNITVVKGATGLSSGIGNPSASINLRRKLADSNVAKGNVNISTSAFDDKWAGYRTTVDVQSPLNDSGTIRGRTVLSYNNYDSFMNWGDSQSALFYSTLGADLGENTTLNECITQRKEKIQLFCVRGILKNVEQAVENSKWPSVYDLIIQDTTGAIEVEISKHLIIVRSCQFLHLLFHNQFL